MLKNTKVLFFILSLVFANFGFSQTADFTVSIPSKQGCSPLTVNYTETSTGGMVASRTWDLGNGVIIPNGPVTVGANYFTPQVYTIVLTVVFTNGVTNSKTDYVTVHPKPIANFESKDSIGCASHTASFLSISTTATGTLTNYQWDFGAGGLSGVNSNPSFAYTNTGQYQVSLIVKNNWGCVSDAVTKPQYIKVFSSPNAYFTVNPNFTCTNSFTAIFTNATTGGDPTRNSFEWDFGDGSPVEYTLNATHTYTGTGNYTATLKVKLGNTCMSTYATTIYVGKPTPTITVFPTDVCVNTPINYVGTGSPNTYYLRWYFPDNNQTQYYGNVTHTFTTTGTFELLLIARNYAGCEDTVKQSVNVKSGPIINLIPNFPDANCRPHTVTFTNNTIGNDLKFAWNYGDGVIDTINGQGNAVHTYTNFNYYTVTVYAIDTSVTGGCFAYKTYNYIRVLQPSVTLNVIPPSGCKPLPVNFTASIGNIIVPILSYSWDFGEGNPPTITTVPSVSNTYVNNGIFNTTVTITMQGGCTYTSLIKTVTVIDLCDDDGSGGGGAGGGGFTIGKSCTDKYTILFSDTVSNSTVLSWDFGDGTPIVNTGILNPISHTFIPPQKIYTVTVARKNNTTNVITTGQKSVKIIDEKANFAPNLFDICKDKNVIFKTIGIDSSLIKKYTWDFGDGTPRQIINNALYFSYYGVYLIGNTNHTYITNGTFYVKLIIEDKLGCLDSLEYPVPIIVAGPIARFTGGPLTSCTSPLSTTFFNGSTPNGVTPIIEWQWTFGDGATLTTTADTAIPHNYTGASYVNFYTVKLKVKDAIGCESDTTRTNYIKIYKPKADFFSYNTLQCNNYNIFLYNNSSAYNATFKWYYGDGTSSTGYYGSHTYATDGDYDIKLVATDENGCMDSITKTSYIQLVKPKANFKISDTLQCAPASITFADSSKYATSYVWDFGDGSGPSTSPNPAPHIYGTPGYYSVKLKIIGVSGCTDSIVKQIRVRGPIATLDVVSGNGCKPYSLQLKATGSFINTYAWDYGDGSPVSANTMDSIVTHTYSNAGKYLPNIVLTSPEGCPYTLKVTDTIIVDSLKAKFTIPQTVFCQVGTTTTVSFNNLTTVPGFSSVLYNNWNFGDGAIVNNSSATVTHTYSGYGTFNVYLATKSKYGCIDTFKLFPAITINAKPIPSIVGNNVYCLKPSSLLQYTGAIITPDPIVKYIWKIDTDSVANTVDLNINYRTPGTHILKYIVTTSKGCLDSITKTIIVDSVLTKFDLTPTQFCGPKLVSFTDQSSNASTIQNYTWTFGDGSIGTTNLSPQHLYANTGMYDVKLYMQTINGCKDSTIKIAAVIIDSVPKASIVGANVFCLKPNSRLQLNSNVITQNPITTYKWFIDGSQVATTTNLDIDYRTAGAHIIKLYVETSKGCNDEITKTIIVDSVLTKFDLTPTQFCGPKLIAFTNQSSNASTIQNYTWTFGDGSIGTTNLSPQHLYANTGMYDVKLYMQTINGCKDSTIKIAAVTIDSVPKAVITGDALKCKPDLYSYISSNSISVDLISNYEWKVDGILIANTANLNHYLNAGNHTISLYIKTNKGCESITTKAIIVDSVKATFTVVNPIRCADDLNVQFINNSGSQFGNNTYAWNFGDGTTSTSINPALHLYPGYGNYNVKLVATSINGCIDSFKITPAVVIHPLPMASIIGDSIKCKPGLYSYASSINSIDAIQNYEWKINGVTVQSTPNLNYNFAAGNYAINLKVKTINNCTQEVTKIIIVDSVSPNFSIVNPIRCGNNNLSVQFNNLSGSKFGIANYLWDFGDGQTSTSINPLHTYNTVGTYNITLTVSSIHGCTETMYLPNAVIIYATPIVTVTNITEKCMNNNIAFTSQVTSQDSITGYLWKVNGVSAGTTNALNYYFANAGNYAVTLEVTTQNGCTVVEQKNVTIRPLPIPQAVPNVNICEGSSITLNAYDGNNYVWSPNTTLQNANTASPTAMPIIDTKYYVTVTNQYGCVQTDSVLIKVDKKVNLITPPSVATCKGTAVQLTASGNTNIYVWSPTTGLSNPNSASTSANPSSTTTYQIVGVSNNVCKSDTGFVTVTVGDIPTVDLGPNLQVIAGTPVTLNPTTTGGVTQYIWTPNTGLSCTNCPQALFIADKNITYKLQVKTQYDCTATDEIDITVLCGKGSIYVPSGFTPNNDGKNDVFYVMGYGIVKIKKFSVFDRWGKRVFYKENIDANNPAYGWDGRVNNQEVTTSTTFVYYIEVECAEGKTVLLKNTIVLVK